MKNLFAIMVILFAGITAANAQESAKEKSMEDYKYISLDQTPGEFTQTTITVDAGTYIFTINNKNVGHDVGFVLVEKGKDINNPENHIKTAYVSAPVANNTTGKSKATKLVAGEYYYFCPLNPTSTDNLLIVN